MISGLFSFRPTVKNFDLSIQNIDFSSRDQPENSRKIPEFSRKFPKNSQENSPTPTPSHPHPLTTTQSTPPSHPTPTSRTSISIFYINRFSCFFPSITQHLHMHIYIHDIHDVCIYIRSRSIRILIMPYTVCIYIRIQHTIHFVRFQMR